MTRKQALTILGLTEGALAEEIKRSYRQMAFDLHPDLHPNNPDAGKKFQRLNEAYVLLSSPDSASKEGARSTQRGRGGASAAEATKKARTEAEKVYARAKKRFQEEAATAGASASTAKPEADQPPSTAGKTREMKRDEVLRDLLRDPFARRVFEDIYSQIRDEAARQQTASPKGRTAKRPVPPPTGSGFLEKTAGNVSDWLRRQIDEEQTVRFAGLLAPGKRVRLQIHHGVFGKPQTIELTLPPEFEPGRPIRLKGLGKRVGKWRGDLYLRILGQ